MIEIAPSVRFATALGSAASCTTRLSTQKIRVRIFGVHITARYAAVNKEKEKERQGSSGRLITVINVERMWQGEMTN